MRSKRRFDQYHVKGNRKIGFGTGINRDRSMRIDFDHGVRMNRKFLYEPIDCFIIDHFTGIIIGKMGDQFTFARESERQGFMFGAMKKVG